MEKGQIEEIKRERKKLILNYRSEGRTLSEISKMLNLSRSTLNNEISLMRRQGIKVPNSRFRINEYEKSKKPHNKFTDFENKKRRKLVLQYRHENKTLNEIALLLGVGKSTIDMDILKMKQDGILVPNSRGIGSPMDTEEFEFRKGFIEEKIKEGWTHEKISKGLGLSRVSVLRFIQKYMR